MKLKKAHIYGFGQWIDQQITFPETNLVCFYGKNETGKSTLKQFILFMLFGFPPKKRRHFYPKESSRMGGRLYLIDEQYGTFTIERQDGVRRGSARCYFEDGKERDEQWLQNYLKGMDVSTYEAIFSFSTADLADIKLMKGDELGEALLTIGLTGYRNIYSVEKKLKEEREKLFKPYGTIPKINEQLNLLEEKEAQVKNMKKEIDTYFIERKQYEQTTKNLEKLKEQIKEIHQSLKANERMLHNYETLIEYFITKEQIETYKDPISFPERGIQRIEDLQRHILPLESEIKILTKDIEEVKGTLKKIDERKLSKEKYTLLLEILKTKQFFDTYEKEKERLVQEKNQLEKETKQQLTKLQINIHFQSLKELTLPFYVKEEWKRCKEQLENILRELNRLEEQKNKRKLEQKQLHLEQKNYEEQLLPKEQHRAYEKILLDQERLLVQKQRKKTKQRLQQHQKERQKRAKKIFISSLIIGIFSLGLGYLFELSYVYIVSIATFVFGISQYFFTIQSNQQMEKLLTLEAKEDIEGESPTEDELEKIRQLLEQQQNVQDELNILHRKMLQLQREEKQLDETYAFLKQQEKEVDEKITKQIETYPFLQYLDVMYWPDVYNHLERLLEKVDKIEELEDRLHSLHQQKQQEITQLEHTYFTIFQEQPEGKREDLFNRLTKRKHEEEQLFFEEEEKKKNLKKNVQAKKKLETKLETFQQEKDLLFQQARVSTIKAFYEQSKIYKKMVELKEKHQNLEKQLLRIFHPKELTQLSKTMADEKTLQNQVGKDKKILRKLEEEKNKELQNQSRLYATLEKLETSEDYSIAVHDFMLEKGELDYLAKEWTVLKVAEQLLKEAKQSYQEKYLSKILSQIEEIFKVVTNGKYRRVFLPSNENSFTVQSNKGIHYSIQELSQGTIEQLYIALKLSIANLMSDKHRIPFIIDDAFVHFDESRLQRMIDILIPMTEEKQIFLFTCKGEVVSRIPKQSIVTLKGDENRETRS